MKQHIRYWSCLIISAIWAGVSVIKPENTGAMLISWFWILVAIASNFIYTGARKDD